MARLNTLKRYAQGATAYRGHRMRWGQVYGRADGPKAVNGKCRTCGAYVWVQEAPAPNGIGVSGLAVAMTCSTRRGD